MHLFATLIGQAASGDSVPDWSNLGIAGISFGMLGFLAKKYWDREQQFDRRIDAVLAKHEEQYSSLVKEGNETLKGLAVVLNGVQTGMAQQLERAERKGPTPEQMLAAFERLERTTALLNERISKGA